MRWLLILTIFILGCKDAAPEIQPTPPIPAPPVVEAPKEAPKETPKVDAPKEETPSKEFIRGYWEGYNGKWWSPFHNTLSSEFRSGRSLGKKDRKQGLEPRYSPPSK